MSKQSIFPPVITVLGHVDHGKTTLLDTIRKTNVAQREAGGITQKIGAYKIAFPTAGKISTLTFIDTPGHEAFIKMRSRGVTAADIVLLVVSSTDGVMPQTEESIDLIKTAGIPFIVVLTKTDLQAAQMDRTKQQLLKAGVMLEGLGGDVPLIAVSAKEGRGITELLELILLVSELHDMTKDADAPLLAVVIESKLDNKRGALVSLIVRQGRLRVSDQLAYQGGEAKVRALIGFDGQNLKEALPGDPVEILGFSEVVPVGATIERRDQKSTLSTPSQSLVPKEKTPISENMLPVILKADTEGAVEAIVDGLPKEVVILEKGTGTIGDDDVFLAKSSKAIILGFNTKPTTSSAKLAQTEGVIIKTYTVIYELLEEIGDAAKELQSSSVRPIGKAEILATFPGNDKTTILGVKIIEGYLQRGMKVALMRKDEKIGEATIATIKQEKKDKTRVDKNQECGITLRPSLDFSLGDMLLSYNSI